MGTTRHARSALAALLLGVVGGGASACDSGAAAYPPTGVDGLEIPSASPRPADFVAAVDNPWFPVIAGTRWVYRTPGGRGTTTVTAQAGPVVDGVPTAALRTRTSGPPVTRATTVDYYAQDRSGNVWWFGRAGEWRAGPGTGAGLMMPAHPRRGDGYWMSASGAAATHGIVVATDRTWQASIGSSRSAVTLEVVRGDVADVETFAPGYGMVRKGETGLVAMTQPRP